MSLFAVTLGLLGASFFISWAVAINAVVSIKVHNTISFRIIICSFKDKNQKSKDT
jgi:hypothetical protein